jgi:hypothetical protein
MIRATTTSDNEIKITSTNHLKSIRAYFCYGWNFQNKNQSTNRFESYQAGLDSLTSKGW